MGSGLSTVLASSRRANHRARSSVAAVRDVGVRTQHATRAPPPSSPPILTTPAPRTALALSLAEPLHAFTFTVTNASLNAHLKASDGVAHKGPLP